MDRLVYSFAFGEFDKIIDHDMTGKCSFVLVSVAMDRVGEVTVL